MTVAIRSTGFYQRRISELNRTILRLKINNKNLKGMHNTQQKLIEDQQNKINQLHQRVTALENP